MKVSIVRFHQCIKYNTLLKSDWLLQGLIVITGVGCSKSYVDNWIAHQDDFNALLSDLQQDHSKGDSKQEDESMKVISLEQKSRTSKGRLQ